MLAEAACFDEFVEHGCERAHPRDEHEEIRHGRPRPRGGLDEGLEPHPPSEPAHGEHDGPPGRPPQPFARLAPGEPGVEPVRFDPARHDADAGGIGAVASDEHVTERFRQHDEPLRTAVNRVLNGPSEPDAEAPGALRLTLLSPRPVEVNDEGQAADQV